MVMTTLRTVPCSYQSGKARYSNEDDAAPEVDKWRNNLTALSQYRNLLFIAYADQIHIFKPQFPAQTLGANPELIVKLPVSRAGLRGFLSPSRAHAVNHLIIGDMGNEEIIVVACDDGDVISYKVSALAVEIERIRTKNQSKLPLRPTNPWFLENVGKSAWGLAIHTEARLLAVSSNTQTIKVFAPALKDNSVQGYDVGYEYDPDYDNSMPEEYLPVFERWLHVDMEGVGDRYYNNLISLEAHGNNIPNIAFFNADTDREGRYLASTDIDGNTFIWDIYYGYTVFTTEGKFSHSSRGWGVACLNPLTSRLTSDSLSTFGCHGYVEGKSAVLDISEGTRTLSDNSHWHPAFSSFGAVPGITPNVSIDNEATQLAFHGEFIQDEVEEVEYLEDSESEAMDEDDVNESGSDEAHQNTQPIIFDGEGATRDPSDGIEKDLQADNSVEQFRQLVNQNSSQSPPGKQPVVSLPFDLLQTSELCVHLYRDISYEPSTFGQTGGSVNTSHTSVVYHRAIHQKLPPGFSQLSRIERLNMIAQIPELGVIVIGNQAGRVGIFTATRWASEQQSGYKIECILPFKSQEEKNMRPKKALMGMAVGPVQGQEPRLEPEYIHHDGSSNQRALCESSRRFRLIMVYCDHTILSYEISRSAQDETLVV